MHEYFGIDPPDKEPLKILVFLGATVIIIILGIVFKTDFTIEFFKFLVEEFSVFHVIISIIGLLQCVILYLLIKMFIVSERFLGKILPISFLIAIVIVGFLIAILKGNWIPFSVAPICIVFCFLGS